MGRLFVIGDSFSAGPMKGDTTQNWARMLCEKIEIETGESTVLINNSLVGSSQDWIWTHLQIWLHYEMTAEDRLVICLTHPSRVWFLERMPELSNANLIDLDRWVTKEEAKAIELYIRYMQRPAIDLMNVNNRLGYVAYQVLRKGFKKPVIIKCFDQDLDQAMDFPELKIANGSLMSDVQYYEFIEPDDETDNKFWHGIDARYNHLCLRNHRVLSDKIYRGLILDEPIDLKTDFHRNFLSFECLEDAEFCKQELDLNTLQRNRENADKFRPIIPWARRVGVKTGLLDR